MPSPRTLALLAMLVAAALAWIAAVSHRRATARPTPTVDYTGLLEQLTAEHQPEGPDGWKMLVDAASRLDQIQQNVRLLDLPSRDQEDSGAAEFDRVCRGPFDRSRLTNELRAIEMLRSASVFDQLAEGAARPRMVRPMPKTDSPMMAIALPDLALLRRMTKARVASMRVAAVDGDAAELVAALEQSLAIGRGCASQPLMVDDLVGFAIIVHVLRELRYLLDEHRFAPETYAAMLEAMDRQLRLPPPGTALEAERLLALDAVQWCYSDDGHGDGCLRPRRLFGLSAPIGGLAWPDGPEDALAGAFIAGRAETVGAINAFYDACGVECELTTLDRASSPFDAEAFAAALTPRHVLLDAILPEVDRLLLLGDLCRLDIRGTRIMVALELYRARHGGYPAELAELVPGCLAELPADPLHGGSYCYHRMGPDAGYRLYSTGLDRTDDAASEPDDDSAAARFAEDVSLRGSDRLISETRPPLDPPR